MEKNDIIGKQAIPNILERDVIHSFVYVQHEIDGSRRT